MYFCCVVETAVWDSNQSRTHKRAIWHLQALHDFKGSKVTSIYLISIIIVFCSRFPQPLKVLALKNWLLVRLWPFSNITKADGLHFHFHGFDGNFRVCFLILRPRFHVKYHSDLKFWILAHIRKTCNVNGDRHFHFYKLNGHFFIFLFDVFSFFKLKSKPFQKPNCNQVNAL